MTNNKHTRITEGITFLPFLYLCICIIIFPYYKYLLNPDGVSYITIGVNYTQGHFLEAFNGYWGPLISWLMIPLLFLRIPPLESFKMINIFIGLLLFFSIENLSIRLIKENVIRFMVLFCALPLIIFSVFRIVTPDVLITMLLLFFIATLYDFTKKRQNTHALLLGFTGALLYFAKAYGLYFFIVLTALTACIFYLSTGDIKTKIFIRKKILMIFITLFLIITPWIIFIRMKYHQFTFSTAIKYNSQIDGIGSNGHPVLTIGLLPPKSYGLSAWDDPSDLSIQKINIPNEQAILLFVLYHVLKNVRSEIDILQSLSLFSGSIFLVLLGLSYTKFRQRHLDSPIVISLLAIVLYSGGYTFFHFEERFIWMITFLLLLLVGYVGTIMLKRARQKLLVFIITGMVCISFCIHPLQGLFLTMNGGKDIATFSQDLQQRYHIQGRIASNTKWDISLLISYYLQAKYYGQLSHHNSDNMNFQILNHYNIAYFFDWDPQIHHYTFLNHFHLIGDFPQQHLRIYRLAHNFSTY